MKVNGSIVVPSNTVADMFLRAIDDVFTKQRETQPACRGVVLTHKPLALGGVRTQFHMTKGEENLIFRLKLSTYGAAPNADGKGV